MATKPNIYLDFDQCLINSELSHGEPPHTDQRLICLSTGEKYHVRLRPCAKLLIAEAQKLADTVKILSTAAQEYIEAILKEFSLPWDSEKILGREKWYYTVSTAYGGSDFVLIDLRVDPTAILLDDMPQTATFAKMKKNYLGIPDKNYIQIPEFTKEDLSSKELNKILKTLKTLSKPPTKEDPTPTL